MQPYTSTIRIPALRTKYLPGFAVVNTATVDHEFGKLVNEIKARDGVIAIKQDQIITLTVLSAALAGVTVVALATHIPRNRRTQECRCKKCSDH